ncbi:hypothetical protein [Agarivorans sp. DSG3-1]|uniref:hypothetical protein n=1 Tax=Agarivorans sp. DSG3-1 TaxID=3342249 RepID=UPI00398F82C3
MLVALAIVVGFVVGFCVAQRICIGSEQFYSLGSSSNGHALFYEHSDFWIEGFKQYMQQLDLM